MSEFFHYCLINSAESIHVRISFVVICSKASLTHLGNTIVEGITYQAYTPIRGTAL